MSIAFRSPNQATCGDRTSNGASGSPCVSVVLGRFDEIPTRGLADVLREDPAVRIHGMALEGAELEQVVTRSAPRATIVDEKTAPTLWVWLRSLRPAPGIVVLARNPTQPYGMVLLAAGISCLAVSARAEDVLALVGVTASGGCMFVTGDSSRFKRPDRDRDPILTRRETQVLRCLSEGMSYGSTARKLNISAATVKDHVTSLLRKLNAVSKRDLIDMPIQALL